MRPADPAALLGRDGNPDIYVMQVTGDSGCPKRCPAVTRWTFNPTSDAFPDW
jgi:hypothetical protein